MCDQNPHFDKENGIVGLKSEMYKILGKATLKQMKKQAKKEAKATPHNSDKTNTTSR